MVERAKRPGGGFRASTANVKPPRGGVNTHPDSRWRGSRDGTSRRVQSLVKAKEDTEHR